MNNRYADRETKTLDVDIEQGEPIVKETWLFEYPDGQVDVLQRRHPVTNVHERETILNEHVLVRDITVQLPGKVHEITVRGVIA